MVAKIRKPRCNEGERPGLCGRAWHWELVLRSSIPAPTPRASWLWLTMALGSPLPLGHQQDQVHTTGALGGGKAVAVTS